MPIRTIRCRQVRAGGGKIYARFSDKSEIEFQSRSELRQWVREQLTSDVIKALILAKVLEDSADSTPLNQCDRLRATLDLASPTLLTIADSAS